MRPILLITTTTLCLLISKLNTQNIGSTCTLEDGFKTGVCSLVVDCPSAVASIRDRKSPQLCEFIAEEPIVCCPQKSILTSSRNSFYRPECAVLKKNSPIRLHPSRRFEHGELFAKKMFAEAPLGLRVERASKQLEGRLGPDIHNIAGGVKVKPEEFAHMVRLGIGQNEDNIEWYCGGSLISDKFILTAAHCIYSRFGKINWALLGDPESKFLQPRVEIIENIIHPSFNYTEHYHDIAISKMKDQILYRANILPACLYVERELLDDVPITVSGWGSTEFGAEGSKDLLKADVSLYTSQECKEKYSSVSRKLPRGIDDETQFCAGGRTEVKDTCQGDSGGPIQMRVRNKSSRQIYTVIGITSFGKVCGYVNQPGVYVRLYPYLPWIESVVFNTTIL